MERLKKPWYPPASCCCDWESLPEGAPLLRATPLRSKGRILFNSKQAEDQQQNWTEQAWGIPFSPEDFILEAVHNGHPQSLAKLVPECLVLAVQKNFSCESDLSRLAGERAKSFGHWTKRAEELSTEEAAFKEKLPLHAKKIYFSA